MLLNDELPCSRLLSKFSYPTPRRKWVNQLLTKLIISEWTDLRKRFASEFSVRTEQNDVCHIEDACSRGWWGDAVGKVFAAQGAESECPLVIKKKCRHGGRYWAWGRYRWVLGIPGHRDLLCAPHLILEFLLLSTEVRRLLYGMWVLSSYLYLGRFQDWI